MQVTYPDVFASSMMVAGIGYGETSAIYAGTDYDIIDATCP